MEKRRQRHEGRDHVPNVQVEQVDGVGELAGAGCFGEVDGIYGK